MPSLGTRRLRRTVNRLRRGFLRSDGFVLLALVALALAVGWTSSEHTAWSPPAMLALVILRGSCCPCGPCGC